MYTKKMKKKMKMSITIFVTYFKEHDFQINRIKIFKK